MSCLFVEQLTVIDCAYLDADRGLVGESWIVDIELEGELDAQSMVLDFGAVKKRLKRAIDDSTDHRLLVPLHAPELTLDAPAGDVVSLRFAARTGLIEHRSPALALTRVDSPAITADAVARHLQPILMQQVPGNVHALRLHLRQERIEGAFYHYVHGLKKHDGACQRIAHGHRSRLEIRVDGVRDAGLEASVATDWRDIYLGTRADVVEDRDGRLRFAYTSREGQYELTLPAHRCDLLDGDTTVEAIAAQLLRRLTPARPGLPLEVRAYEGVMKGAIARRGK
jgi:6-pyruvoyl-tetrahydropterin synthase